MTSQSTAQSDLPSLSRGSEWRKWDLHVHSPLSALRNQYPKLPDGTPDWELFVSALEALTDIAVLGITDYFTIEGYKQIADFREQGRLRNIALILPNIEFRLDKFVGSRNCRLNLHVIFSDEVSTDDIEEHFLRNLEVCVEGTPQAPGETWRITRPQLEQLGGRLKGQHLPFGDRSNFEIGCMNATVRAEKIRKVLEDKPSVFRDRYLVVLADQDLSRLGWDGQDHLTRKTLLQGSDAIFSGNPSTRDWALGLKDLSPDEFRAAFKTLKPCLHGSDAHSLDRIARPDQNRYCWVKADPTFEGLRQVLYEPAERVFIGEQPPKLKNEYQVIDSIRIENATSWFDPVEIPFSEDLAAIIGGRGAGKSALADVVAFAGGAEIFKSSKDVQDSFLSKASRRSPTNPSPITSAVVTLRWRDGTADAVTIGAGLQHGLAEEKVKYLPQKFVERLCAPENTEDLRREIERIVFNNLDPSERLDAVDFGQLRERTTGAIGLRKRELSAGIGKLNAAIADTSARIAERPAKHRELLHRRSELESLMRQAPQLPAENQMVLAELADLAGRRQRLERLLAEYRGQQVKLDEIEARVELFLKQVEAFNRDVTPLLDAVGLSAERGRFLITLPPEGRAAIVRRRDELGRAVAALRDGDPQRPGEDCLRTLDAHVEAARGQLQLSEAKRQEYEKFHSDRKLLEESIGALEREIREIDDVLGPRLEHDIAARLECYSGYFRVLLEERTALEGLYEPLRTALAGASEIAQKLAFTSKITCNPIPHADRAEAIFDGRKLRGREEPIEVWLKSFNRMQEAEFQDEAVREGVRAVETWFLPDGRSLTGIADLLRKNRTPREFDDWLFGTEHFSVAYELTYDGKDLRLLSPGEKGVVLLLLYLEAEKADNRPLIIDQPDDNLDNLSVYPSLVAYFRECKKTRQIIIITHNPNLVVNADAEQVIVANFDGSRTPRIRYRAGALEDTQPEDGQGIRECVCRILEGGTEAFRRREQKYSLPPL
jgi:predicted ATPase